jgi:hypothetical protein
MTQSYTEKSQSNTEKKAIMNLFKKIFLLTIICVTLLPAQIKFTSVGGGLGLGTIQGNSTSVSAACGSINTDFKLWFSNAVSFRFEYTHARQTEYFLPENRDGKYYPFMNIYNLRAGIQQPLSPLFYIEETAGLLALNDRTFGDINLWDFGGMFSLLGGVNLRNNERKGFVVGLSFEYGITINQTTANFSFIKLQTQYYF